MYISKKVSFTSVTYVVGTLWKCLMICSSILPPSMTYNHISVPGVGILQHKIFKKSKNGVCIMYTSLDKINIYMNWDLIIFDTYIVVK